jgi:hypothetical protein
MARDDAKSRERTELEYNYEIIFKQIASYLYNH